jgi:leader peptidase (prepilin peptidase) / N-methyltransferase
VTGTPDALPVLWGVWVAVLGATVGSFLNVVIARVPAGVSIVHPGSRCPKCEAPIRWYDNLPILSWLVLRARCRKCRAPISVRYPLVEAMGLAAALIAYARHGLSARAALEFAFAASLVALAFIDLDTWLLPNAITWPLIVVSVALGALHLTPAAALGPAFLGALIGFAAFASISFIGEKVFKREALGFGDVWLLAGLGGYLGPLALVPVVLLASTEGAVVGVALLLLGKGEKGPDGPRATAKPGAEEEWVPPRHAVPFGPFLVAGALEWLWLARDITRALPVLELFR